MYGTSNFVDISCPGVSKQPRQVFVAYAYRVYSRDDYRSVFSRVGDKLGVTFVFADRDVTQSHILQKITNCIKEAQLSIFDITGWNPNVTLELGLSVGMDERSVLFFNPKLKRPRDVPSDIKGADRVEYSSFSELETKLEALISARFPRPDAETKRWSENLSSKPAYGNWSFWINWPLAEASSKCDAFSYDVTCSRLLDVLANASISTSKQEFDSVLQALDRITASATPPKKLSGEVLFSEVSKKVIDGVQGLLGTREYERVKERRSEKPVHEPLRWTRLLPEHALFRKKDFFDRYSSSQERISLTASQICKSVLCSTYQISISQSFVWPTAGKPITAIVCTARNRRKESLSAVADIPVILADERRRALPWYGLPDRPPTSEYSSHCEYHRAIHRKGIRKTYLVHFHPIRLITLYDRIAGIEESEHAAFWNRAETAAEDAGLCLRIFRDYIDVGARSREFGTFLSSVAAATKSEENVVVWKPDHGIWLLLDPSTIYTASPEVRRKSSRTLTQALEVVEDLETALNKEFAGA